MNPRSSEERRAARLLLAIVRERWDEAESIVRDGRVDPAVFVESARASDVHPWVHAVLDRADRFDLVGTEAREPLERMRRKCRMDNMLLLGLAEQAIDRLLSSGIVPIALKGLDSIHRLGVGFDERTLDDIDVLVEPGSVRPAIETLEAAGWRAPSEPERTHWLRSSHHLMLSSSGPVPVEIEIHWNLVQTRRYRLDPEDLVRRALPLEVGGRSVLRLEDHDAAANLLLHHLAHFFDRRLKWALDLARLQSLPGFRWETVAARLRDWGGSAAAGMSLVHLRRLVPEAVPAHALDLLPVSGWRRAMGWPLRSSHPLDLFRATRRRPVQLWIAALLLERPSELPGWLLHRARRDRLEDEGPLAGPRGSGAKDRA